MQNKADRGLKYRGPFLFYFDFQKNLYYCFFSSKRRISGFYVIKNEVRE